MELINFDHFFSSISSEFRFVIDTFSLSNRTTSIRQRPDEFNFRSFLHVLKRHEVLLPLSITMDKLELSLTEPELSKLRNVTHEHSMKQLKVSGDLLKLLSEFKKQDIDVMPLKGPLLSQSLYGSFANRESADLDLLISPDDLQNANQLFERLGYISQDYVLTGFSAKQWRVFKKVHCNTTYVPGQQGATVVELHWKMFEAEELYHKKTECLISESVEKEFQGLPIKVMSNEDLFIYLSIHGAKHRWAGLKWLIDIRQFMLKHDQQTDWEALLKRCADHQIHWPVWQALYLSHGLFGTSLPPGVLESVHKEQSVKALIQDALDNLGKENFKDNNWTHTMNIIKLKPGWQHIRFYIDRLFYAPQDWSQVRLPDFLFFLYFPMRPFLMLYRKLRS